jgi:hypothetical protein
MINKKMSVGFVSTNQLASQDSPVNRVNLYRDEKKVIKESFKTLGNTFNWNDAPVDAKVREFAKDVIETITEDVTQKQDLLGLVLPVEDIEPGETFVLHELHGVNIYYASYGGAVRMSRPQFTKYSGTTTPKEIGLDFELQQIKAGKYSPTELADYATGLITAWRNHLLFVTTLAGMTAYQSGGAQYQSGTTATFLTMDNAIDKLTDEGETSFIIGRRYALHKLSRMTGWSDDSKDQFRDQGQIGRYAGMPVMKTNSFTDPDYGTVYPMPKNEMWLFSSMPAGWWIKATGVRTAEETILQNERLHIYIRWDDGIAITHTNRISRIAAIT